MPLCFLLHNVFALVYFYPWLWRMNDHHIQIIQSHFLQSFINALSRRLIGLMLCGNLWYDKKLLSWHTTCTDTFTDTALRRNIVKCVCKILWNCFYFHLNTLNLKIKPSADFILPRFDGIPVNVFDLIQKFFFWICLNRSFSYFELLGLFLFLYLFLLSSFLFLNFSRYSFWLADDFSNSA